MGILKKKTSNDPPPIPPPPPPPPEKSKPDGGVEQNNYANQPNARVQSRRYSEFSTSSSRKGSKGSKGRDRSSGASEHTTTGNFVHLRKKVKKYYYDEILQRPDPFFHVDVGAQCDSYFRGQKVRFKEKKAEHFASVVDLDAYEYHKVVFHTFLNEILQSSYFRSIILFLVMLNAVMIGIGTFQSATDNPKVQVSFLVIDQIVLSVFIFEIILKWLYDFRLFWKTAWNILDFAIIFLIISPSVLPLLSSNGRALVTVRVVRAFRSLRSVSSMASLSIVSHTIVKSGRDMANIIMVLIVFMLVMSVMGVILFDIEEINLPNFQNGLDAWFTVFICVTQDGWADILEEFINFGGPDHTNNYDKLLVIYLLIAISAGGFVFANLIVAVIVTNLEMAVKEFREEKAMSDNPLELHSEHSAPVVDILSVHELLVKDNTALIAQRPFKIPSLKKISLRRLQTYIGLIVALEHNMLEAELIHADLERVMAVIVATMSQLDAFKSHKRLQAEKDEALVDLNKYAAMVSAFPTDKLTQMETLEQLRKFKDQRRGSHYGIRDSYDIRK